MGNARERKRKKRGMKRILAVMMAVCVIASMGCFADELVMAEVSEDVEAETLSDDMGEQSYGEILTAEMVEEYKEDGTWEDRVNFMKELSEINSVSNQVQTYSMVESDNSENLAKVRNAKATMASVGEIKVLVFLVDFQDIRNTDENYTSEAVEEVLFGNGITNPNPALLNQYKMFYSLTQYYQISSKNKLNITGDAVGWYTASGNRADYEDGSVGREKLIKELLEYYDDTIDFSQYDGDGNGSIDNIYINFAGDDTGWGSQWWSYMTKWYYNEPMEVDGVCVDGYVWLHESLYSENYQNTLYTMATIHETGHCLGLPDYYDYEAFSLQGEGGGIGGYDMMDANVGDHNAFSKLMLGWIEEKDIQIVNLSETEQQYYLENFADTNQILIVSADWEGDYCSEYFLLEYYTSTGLNATGMPSENGGIRLWHVNAQTTESGTDFLNDNSYTTYKLLRLMEADGKDEIGKYASFGANEGDLYKTGDMFNANTVPNSDYYNKVYSGIAIEFGACTDGKYEIRVHKEKVNSEVPSVISITADSDSKNFWENTLYSGKAMTITFSNDITVLDESKLVFKTIEGTECTTSDIVVGDNYITFQIIGGDETTQAYLEIQPGYYGNTSGIANEKTYHYNIKNIVSDFKEKNMLGTCSYEEATYGLGGLQILGTVENSKGGKNAVVLHGKKKEIYLVDSEDMSQQVTLDMPAYNTNPYSYGVSQLNEGKFALYYQETTDDGLSMAVSVFDSDGKRLGIYEEISDNKSDSICGGIMDLENNTVGWMFEDYNGDGDTKEYDEDTNYMIEPAYLMTFHYITGTLEKKKVGYVYNSGLLQFQQVGDNWYSFGDTKNCLYVFDGNTLTKKYIWESDSGQCVHICQIDEKGIRLIYAEGTPDSTYPWCYEVNREYSVCVADISLENYKIKSKTILMQYIYNTNMYYNPTISALQKTDYGYLARVVVSDSLGTGWYHQKILYVAMDAAYNILKIYPTEMGHSESLCSVSNGTELWMVTNPDLMHYSVPKPEVLTYPVHISTNKEERLSLCGDYQLLAGGILKLGVLLESGENAAVKVNGKDIKLEDGGLIIDKITEELFIDVEIKDIIYTVDFDVNGGDSLNQSSKEVKEGEAIGELPDITRDGYSFQGWFTQKSGGEKVTADTVVNVDMTLYAQWKILDSQEPSDGTGSDNGGSDDNGSDNSGSDNSDSDNSGSDNTDSDNTGSDNSGSDNSGSDDNNSEDNGSDNNGSDNSGSDDNGSDNSGSDNSGSDNNGSDNSGSDSSGSDNNNPDDSGSGNNGSDNTGSDNSGSDNNGSDNSGSDNSDSDNSGSDNTDSGNSGSDNSGSDNNNPDDNGSNNNGSDNSSSDNSGSDNSGSDNTDSDNSGSDNSGSDNSGSDNNNPDDNGSNNNGSDNSGSDNSGSDNSGSDDTNSDNNSDNNNSSGDSGNSGSNGSETQNPDSTSPEQTTPTDVTTITNEDGSTTAIKQEVAEDGSNVTTAVTEKTDGTVETIIVLEKTDGSRESFSSVTWTDGSVVARKESTNADGTTTVITATANASGEVVSSSTTTIAADGSKHEVAEAKEKNKNGKTVDVTTTVDTDAAGQVVGSVEQSVIANAAKNTSVVVNVVADGSGTVQKATGEITRTVNAGTKKATIAGSVVNQIKEAAGTGVKADVSMKVVDESGKTLYTVKGKTNSLKAGTKLYLYRLDVKTGKYIAVTDDTYKVSNVGSVSVSMDKKATYELVTAKEAKAIQNEIKKSIALKKTSATLQKGKTTTVAFKDTLDKRSVKSITYTSSDKKVATVDKNGKVTAKAAGTTDIKAKVTLNDGTTKTVTMKITVK